jgi:predicted AAA+ superfamily ATPase
VSAASRIAYADLDAAPLVAALGRAAVHPGDDHAARDLAEAVYGLAVPVAEAVASLVLASTGPFARLARTGIAPGDPRLRRAAAELDELGRLAHADLRGRLAAHGLEDAVPVPAAAAAPDRPPAYAALLRRLAAGPGWGALAPDLARFHAAEGTGALAAHRVLRYADGALRGVPHPDPMTPADLFGGDARRAPLARSLAAFADGGPANDALLYGPPGTGKSATVRALAAGVAHTGLRLVQVERTDAAVVGALFAALEGEGPRCLVLLDDLVFDDAERTDRALRAALEGDAAGRPANVLVWATSNRLKLMRESRSERDDDMEDALGRGEKAALATRFGLRVGFMPLGREEYLRIALGYLERLGGETGGGAADAAMRFARGGHGLTPRTARQFAVDRVARAGSPPA